MLKLTRISKSEKVEPDESDGQAVLYVEDEDVNWEVAELSLRSKFSLTRAKTAQEAFRLLATKTFDLILMDIQLMGSDFNGIEITQILKGRFDQAIPEYAQGITAPNTKIIFVTAYSARYGKKELIEAGGDDLMTKPVDFTRLSLVMSRMMARSAYSDPSNENAPPERRQAPRVDLQMDFQMDCQIELAESTFKGAVSNISLGGAQVTLKELESNHPLKTGANVQLSFTTPWGKLVASAKIIELSEATSDLRLAFGYIPPASKDLLENWLKQSNPS